MSKSFTGLYKSHKHAVVEQGTGISIFELNTNKLCGGMVVQEDLLSAEKCP